MSLEGCRATVERGKSSECQRQKEELKLQLSTGGGGTAAAAAAAGHGGGNGAEDQGVVLMSVVEHIAFDGCRCCYRCRCVWLH